MEMSYSTFLMAISSPFRLAILTFLFLWLFRRPFIYIYKKAVDFLLWIIKIIIMAFIMGAERLLILLFKIIGKVLHPLLSLFEEFKIKTIQGLPEIRRKWGNQWVNKPLVKKRYKIALFVIPVLFAFITHQWPEFKLSALWYEKEDNFLRETMNLQPITHTDAQALLLAEVKGWSAKLTSGKEEVKHEEQKQFYQLKKKYKDGNIRQNPDRESQKVTFILPNEPVLFMNEEAVDDRGSIWYKVETEKGEIGWISSNIIDKY